MQTSLTCLRDLSFFCELTDHELQKAMNCLKLTVVEFPADTCLNIDLFHAKIGLILAGHLFIEKHDALGEYFIIASVEKEDLIWPEQLGLTEEHIFSVKKSVRILLFEQANFSKKCPLRSYIYQQLLKQSMQQNQKLMERVDLLGCRRLRERILYFLQKQEKLVDGKITIPYSREEMAKYLQVDRSALSRELGSMQREGILDYHRNTFMLLNS